MNNYTHTLDTASASKFNLIHALGVTRHEAQQWCLSHAFELVELNPQELPDEDGEFCMKEKSKSPWPSLHLIHFSSSLLHISDDFPESTGVKRIIQALNANVWSSVEMKDGKLISNRFSLMEHVP